MTEAKSVMLTVIRGIVSALGQTPPEIIIQNSYAAAARAASLVADDGARSITYTNTDGFYRKLSFNCINGSEPRLVIGLEDDDSGCDELHLPEDHVFAADESRAEVR